MARYMICLLYTSIRLYMAWYVPFSLVREGLEPIDDVDVHIVPVVNERGEPAGYIDTSIQLSDKYRACLLYTSGFTNSVNSEDFERFNKVYKFLVKNFATSIRLEEVSTLVGDVYKRQCRYFARSGSRKTFC